MTEPTSQSISQSKLGDYARCPRYYELKRIWNVETPDDTIRYLKRGTAMHNAIESTWLWAHPDIETDDLDADAPNPVVDPMGSPLPVSSDDLQSYATDALEAEWERIVPLDAYQTESHYTFDRQACRAAISAYFDEDGDGIEHFEQAVASEAALSFEHNGSTFRGYLDLILQTESGIHVIDFKSSFSTIISGSSYFARLSIEDHQNGEKHKYNDMKSLMQAALYRRAAEELDRYDPGMEVEFSFYALRDNVETISALGGVRADVTGKPRKLTRILNDHHDTVWELIEEYTAGICAEEFEPEPWELINDAVCDECSYQEMCPDYLGSEVSYFD